MKRFILPALFLAAQLVTAQSVMIAAKEKGKLYGYIDGTGQYVIQPSFDLAGPFYRNLAVVKKGKKYGVINSQGEFTVVPTYEDAIDYAPDGKITVKQGGKWGVINEKGEVIIPIQYSFLSVFMGGYYCWGHRANQQII